MINECGPVGGIKIGKYNQNTLRKSSPVPLCPAQTPNDLTWKTHCGNININCDLRL
jgi:hypothetical protein